MGLLASHAIRVAAFARRWTIGLVACCALIPLSAHAQSEASGKTFDEQSAALRTALHYDPSLGQPLRTLVQLYQKQDRVEEMLGLYRAHVAGYPDDAGAQVVLIRLLAELQRPEAVEMLQAAAQRFPDHAELQHLLYGRYRKTDDPRALVTLSRAVDLQQQADRRDVWLDELLELSREREQPEVAEKHLLALREAAGSELGALLAVAKRMYLYEFYPLAIEALEAAKLGQTEPETGIEIEVLLAKSEAASGQRAAAGKRMQEVLDKSAPDYWRRREMMTLRLQMVESQAERDEILASARLAHEKAEGPARESAALDYAELLMVSGLRAQAADVLIAAAADLPSSERIEKAALEALDRLSDEEKLRTFLVQRSAQNPERSDLRYRLVQAQYLAGETEAAEKNLVLVLDALDGDEKTERVLELARSLRKLSLAKAAVDLLEKVVADWPRRLDVRRELVEELLGLEQRSRASVVVRDSDFENAEIENFLDLVQFLVQSDFHVEAQEALRRRLANEPGNFDLQLLLVDVLARIGERNQGEVLLKSSRDLADTAVRYRRWLDTGLAFHEVFGDPGQFFDKEQFDFAESAEAAAEWDEDRMERFLGLIESGSERKLDARVTQTLRNQLARQDLPAELSLKLRSLLVKTLEQSPEHATEVEQHLRELAAADGNRAAEYDLRRALLYHSAQRPDLARELIADIDLSGIDDQGVLRAAYVMFLDYDSIAAAVECVERLTEKSPGELVNYQRQLSLYAALGREDDLRRTVRLLLAGIDKITLETETLTALRGHLLDSCWRSISARLLANRPAALSEVAELLDSVEREALTGDEKLWVLWTRGWLLHRSGQADGSDALLAELEDLLKDSQDIVFPDGMATSLIAARALFREQSPSATREELSDDVSGPLQPLDMRWAFECDEGVRLVQIEEVRSSGAVMAVDDSGTVYCIEAESGKLRWRERFGFAGDEGASIATAIAAPPRGLGSVSLGGVVQQEADQEFPFHEVAMPGRILADEHGHFFVPAGDVVECRSVADGALLWLTELSLKHGSPPWAATHDLREARPPMVMAIRDGRLLAFAPAIGVAVAIDAANGKLLWLHPLVGGDGGGASSGAQSLASGAAFGEHGRMLVFGERCEILDQKSGATLWSLGRTVPRRFPLRLDSVAQESPDEEVLIEEGENEQSAASVGVRTEMAVTISHGSNKAARLGAAARFVQFSGQLLAPAAQWSQQVRKSGSGSLACDAWIVGDELFLLGEGATRVSLELPIAAQYFPSAASASASWIGEAGSRFWRIEGERLLGVDVESGGEVEVSLADVIGESGVVFAAMQGSRIYVCGELGAAVVHGYSGDDVAKFSWPKEMIDYQRSIAASGGRNSGWNSLKALRRVWQGGIFGAAGEPLLCVPDRACLQVTRSGLYVAVGDGCFVALEEQSVKSEGE